MFQSVNGGILPKRQTKYSAGYDVYSNEKIMLNPHETKLISLGIKLDQKWLEKNTNEKFKEENYIGLYIRSSLALKGLMLGNSIGIIDIDYPEEIKLIVYNTSKLAYTINRGDRIAQLILQPHNGIKYLNSMYSTQNRRNSGFGSTD